MNDLVKNKSLSAAKRNKQDEFYTQISDIEKELRHYKDHFEDKVVFCNCDDPEHSNFWWYFKLNFEFLGLKKLVTTHYDEEKPTYKLVIDGTKRDKNGNPIEVKIELEGNGDFRSPESIEILKESDIVVTNPPFSLFREYLAQLIEYDKSFIVLGNQNAITYKDVFGYMKDNRVWLGYKSGDMSFMVPDDYEPRATRYWVDESGQKWRSMGNICWYTNLPHEKRYQDLILVKKYYDDKSEYPTYDEYDVINVNKVKDIPEDYAKPMGVPITFLDKYNPEQFEILGLANSARWIGYECYTILDGKKVYNRIIIRNRRLNVNED